jgi:hypothetical protein
LLARAGIPCGLYSNGRTGSGIPLMCGVYSFDETGGVSAMRVSHPSLEP